MSRQVYFSKCIGFSKSDRGVSEQTTRIRYKEARFAQSSMTLVHINVISEHYFVNIDETAVYFDSNHNCTIYERGAKTVLLRRGCTADKRCTVCVNVSGDGTKLPLFVVFKRTANGRIVKVLLSIMPDSMYGCTLEKGCLDN